MKTIILLFGICVSAIHAAAILPIDTAYVKSDRVGNDFSYSIQENRGAIAVEPLQLQPIQYQALQQQPLLQPTSSIPQQPAAKQQIQSLQNLPALSIPINYIPAYSYNPYALPIAYNLVTA